MGIIIYTDGSKQEEKFCADFITLIDGAELYESNSCLERQYINIPGTWTILKALKWQEMQDVHNVTIRADS